MERFRPTPLANITKQIENTINQLNCKKKQSQIRRPSVKKLFLRQPEPDL